MARRLRFTASSPRGLYAVAALALLGILLTPALAAAQAAVGALVGNVSDESGGAVPGATITATETRTNISIPPLPPPGPLHFTTRIGRIPVERSSCFRNSAATMWRSRELRFRGHLADSVRWKSRSPSRGKRREKNVEPTRAHHQSEQSLNCRSRSSKFPGALAIARRVAPLPSTFGVLQLAGQPVEQRQRAGAAVEQRAARGDGQQR